MIEICISTSLKFKIVPNEIFIIFITDAHTLVQNIRMIKCDGS